MEQIKYPKVLSNIPEGKDSFKAGAHKNIANTISSIIENQGKTIDKQVIGLQGDWGSGKSNIIKIIEGSSQDNCIHFVYDAWTHQEDLTRKSILQELIVLLKSSKIKVINGSDKKWKVKENKLFQKVVNKNINYFPKIKPYIIFCLLALIVIKLGNDLHKVPQGTRLVGFYEDSITYITDNFDVYGQLHLTYLLKLFPFLLLGISIALFTWSFVVEIRNTHQEPDFSWPKVIGSQFYWLSGEKTQSDSTETISESEPSNQTFREFLKAIDEELQVKGKKLIFVIDNTDRLSGEKLTKIWATINTFFAESSNFDFLKNIWLIIPYDENKVLDSMGADGKGLLEKTFTISFKVPPILLSNWESFFDECFAEAFGNLQIENQYQEVQIIKRLFEEYESCITPRKIINLINELASYYIQNRDIDLRYYAIAGLAKKEIFAGNTNENIANRHKYLKGLYSAFTGDKRVEVNLSKIIYGVTTDTDAEEALLHNNIQNALSGKTKLSEAIMNVPFFESYFAQYFKKFLVGRSLQSEIDNPIFDYLSEILFSVYDIYSNKSYKDLYKGLWFDYSATLMQNDFTAFTETHKGVIQNCPEYIIKEFLNKSIVSSGGVRSKSKKPLQELNYVNFLKKLESYLDETKIIPFKDLDLIETQVDCNLFFQIIRENPTRHKDYKLVVSQEALIKFFKKDEADDLDIELHSDLVIQYKNEIINLFEDYDFNFLFEDLNLNWLNKEFIDLQEIEVLFTFYDRFNLENKNIAIDQLSTNSVNSIARLIKNRKILDVSKALTLVLLNYKYDVVYDDGILEIFKTNPDYLIPKIKECIDLYFNDKQKLNILYIPARLEQDDLLLITSLSKYLLYNVKLTYDSFNNILLYYSSLIEYSFGNDDKLVTKIIFKNYNSFKAKFEFIDSKLLSCTHKQLSKRIIKDVNNYLIGLCSEGRFDLLESRSVEYDLLNELMILEQITNKLLERLYEPLKNLAIYKGGVSEDIILFAMQIKQLLDSSKILELIKKSDADFRTKNVVIFTPEIFEAITEFDHQTQLSILSKVGSQPTYYSNEFLNSVAGISNTIVRTTVKQNLRSNRRDLLDYAKTIGLA